LIQDQVVFTEVESASAAAACWRASAGSPNRATPAPVPLHTEHLGPSSLVAAWVWCHAACFLLLFAVPPRGKESRQRRVRAVCTERWLQTGSDGCASVVSFAQ